MRRPRLERIGASDRDRRASPGALVSDDRPCLILADRATPARDALGSVLAAHYDVAVADTPVDALTTLRTTAAELVVARVGPGFDGLKLVHRARADPALLSIPVILLADEAAEDAVLGGFQAGADDYLVGPLGARLLLARVAVQLRIGRLRRAARAREQQFAAIFDQAAIGIGQAALSGQLQLVNQRYCDIVGRPRDEVLGLRVQDLTHPDDVPANLALWQRMIDTGEGFTIEKRYLRPDGALMWVNNRITLLLDADGAPQSCIAVVQDITERKRTEAALLQLTETLEQRIAERTRELTAANRRLTGEIEERRQAESLLEREQAFSDRLIESSTEAIVAIDTELRHTVWNAAATAMTGVPRSAVLGRTLTEAMPQVANTAVETAWHDALAGRTSSVEGRAFTVPATGRSGVYDASYAPLHGADGAIIGAIGMLRDITAQRRAEEALRQAQKMEAVGQLTGGVAHDFNNLLTVITGNLETLQRRLGSDSPLHRQIDAALRGTDRAATLTHRLLAFSRRQTLDPKPVDPNGLVAGMSDLLKRTLGETISVENVAGVGAWRIRCDPNQLESAILNLAVNSRDAMPDGGKLTIETANVHVDQAYAASQSDMQAGRYVVISVTDTGSGMTRDVAEKAFEPFFTTKQIGQGTGLGLSQVYGFTKQSGGHTKIYSEPGQGTSIKLYLPRFDAPIADETAPNVDPNVPVGSRHETILVVEDDEDVRQHTVELLRELGYDVIEAPDGPSALGLIDRGSDVQLLFTDVALPGGMDGRELAEAARRRAPAIKVLFTTGYARSAILRDGALDPDVALVVKPFTYTNLATKIRDVLGG